MSAPTPKVLVVEDDDAIRTLLVAAIRREPFDVDAAADGVVALQMTQSNEYAVIVLDLMMPRLNGFEFLQAFRRSTPDARSVVFVITAFDEAKIARLSAKDVHAVIRKPFDVPQLVTMIREVALLWASQTAADSADHVSTAQHDDGGHESAGERPN
jgi:DNA-binding response OmpR family regulator